MGNPSQDAFAKGEVLRITGGMISVKLLSTEHTNIAVSIQHDKVKVSVGTPDHDETTLFIDPATARTLGQMIADCGLAIQRTLGHLPEENDDETRSDIRALRALYAATHAKSCLCRDCVSTYRLRRWKLRWLRLKDRLRRRRG